MSLFIKLGEKKGGTQKDKQVGKKEELKGGKEKTQLAIIYVKMN